MTMEALFGKLLAYEHELTQQYYAKEKKGPYTRVRGNIRSGGESVIMLGLRLA